MGLPSPGPRDAPGMAAFPTLTGLGSARRPPLPAENQPRGSETPRLAPRQGCCRSPCKQGIGGQQPAALHSHSERRRKALGGGQGGTGDSGVQTHERRAGHTLRKGKGRPSGGRREAARANTASSSSWCTRLLTPSGHGRSGCGAGHGGRSQHSAQGLGLGLFPPIQTCNSAVSPVS